MEIFSHQEKEVLRYMMSRLEVLPDKKDIERLEQQMSKITDWAAQEQADLTAIKSTLDGITTGIANLDAKITALQNSPGTLSAEDQKALDDIQAASKAVVAQAAAIKTDAPAPAPKPTPPVP